MKTFIVSAIAALAIAAPAVAQTQLERSVGAAAGQYTLAQLVELKAKQSESGNDARSYFQANPVDVSSRSRHSATALRIFQQLESEDQGDKQ